MPAVAMILYTNPSRLHVEVLITSAKHITMIFLSYRFGINTYYCEILSLPLVHAREYRSVRKLSPVAEMFR